MQRKERIKTNINVILCKKIMKVIESLKIKEKIYEEKLENGLLVMIVPKKTTNKNYARNHARSLCARRSSALFRTQNV